MKDYEKARLDLEALYRSFGLPVAKVTKIPNCIEEGWKHTKWLFNIAGIEFLYKTGIAITATPTPAEVVACYAREGFDAEQSFADWCGSFGYIEDSRKALETYLACQKSGQTTVKLVGYKNAKALAELAGML